MFTGIIRAVEKLKTAQEKNGGVSLTIQTPRGWKIRVGDSIAVDGVCLTVSHVGKGTWQANLMEETLKKTTFGERIPTVVNLEQSLRLSDRLDGHFVMGHVDTVGHIKKIRERHASRVLTISFPRSFSHLVAPKGSIAIQGVSLTVVDAGPGSCTVSLVDYTFTHTTFDSLTLEDSVNIEFDIFAKYVARNSNRRI